MSVAETRESMALLNSHCFRARTDIALYRHDMDVVFSTAHRIAVLHQGRIIAEGAPAAIREHAEVKRVYLGDRR
jgi:branched-chain amino acid transport system ATP-binding protein